MKAQLAGLSAIVFDVDGTLVDSERDGHRVAFNLAFAAAGLAERWDVDLYGRLLKVPGGRARLRGYLIDRGFSASVVESMADRVHANKTLIMRELVDAGAVPLRPGVMAFVERAEQHNLALYVATTGTRAWVEPLLARHFGTQRFAGIVTGTEVATLKPDPAAYLEVLRLSGLAGRQCLAVEDSEAGVTSAVAAGLACLAVSNDYTHEHDLSAANHRWTSFEADDCCVGRSACDWR